MVQSGANSPVPPEIARRWDTITRILREEGVLAAIRGDNPSAVLDFVRGASYEDEHILELLAGLAPTLDHATLQRAAQRIAREVS